MIKDPRQYSIVYPDSNIVINQAQQVLEDRLNATELRDVVADLLRNENDALINVALNLAPNYEQSNLIRKTLNRAINEDGGVCIFAIPVVLVMGSKSKAKVNSVLPTDELNKFFVDKEIFRPGFDSFVSGKLIDPGTIASIKLSQLYYWTRNLQQAKLWLPIEVTANPIEVMGEGVFLRFIVGVAIGNSRDENKLPRSARNDVSEITQNMNPRLRCDDSSCCNGDGYIRTLLNEEAFSKNSMELMQLINKELKVDGVTMFPIPFAPISLSSAYVVGNEKRTEIAISVAVSNIVRKIRELKFTPNAVLGVEGEAIKLTINCAENKHLTETSLWHLNRFDDFNKIVGVVTALLDDIQIEYSYE